METIGAVVCTLNSESSIEECLQSLLAAKIDQIVVVDGGSTDRTLDILLSLGISHLTDPGNGLGLARNIGVQMLVTDLALIVGSDNIITEETVNSMRLKLADGYLGVSCRTRVASEGYLGFCLNSMWQAKITSGVKNYIGTPQLFTRKTLSQFPFSLESSFSDDTELCARLIRNLGGNFFTVEDFCEEVGKSNLAEIRKRFKIYGLSDWEIYTQNSEEWNVGRKFRSILHPMRTEFLTYIRYQPFLNSLVSLPILIYVTILRYKSWTRKSLRETRKSRSPNFE